MKRTPQTELEAFFEPAITLYWKGSFGTLGSAFYPDKLEDRAILEQFMREAGLPRQGIKITPDQYDAVLAVAGNHGYSICLVGEPEETPA